MAQLNSEDRRAFTLTETLIAVLITSLVFLCVWSIYLIGWTWFHEVAPRIDAQRIARLAVTKIIEGSQDSTTGQDVIGPTTYKRKNGIASAYYAAPVLVGSVTNPDGSTTPSSEINFGIFQDYGTYQPSAARNVRSYYLGTDADTGLNVVYYKDSSGAVHKINSTLGIKDLKFQQYFDDVVHPNIIKVTATVEKKVQGLGSGTSYDVLVSYSDYTYLKNVQ